MKSIFWIIFFAAQSSAQESTTQLTTSSAGPLICNPASFKLIMDDPIRYDRARKILVLNNKKDECSKNPTYVWSVYQLNTDVNPGQVTHVKIENVLDFEGPSDKTENNLLLSRADVSVQLYLYKLQMSVQLIPAPGWNPWFQNKTFLVRPYDMTVTMKGSYHRVHLYKSEDLILDASTSSDRSYRDNGVEAMKQNEIEWSCEPPSVHAPEPGPLTWTIPDKILNEILSQENPVITCTVSITRTGTPFFPQKRASQQYITLRKPPKPKIKLTCTQNCDPSDAFKETTVVYECESNCLDHDPQLTFNPYNETIATKHFINQSMIGYITFPADAFKPGDHLEIEANLGEATAKLSLSFRIPQPELKLTCVENCEYDPRAETIIRLECLSDCGHLGLTWNLSRADVDPKDWLTDDMTLTIEPGVFKDGDNLIVTVTSYDSVVPLDVTFYEEAAELELTCEHYDGTDCKDSLPDPREIIHWTVTCKTHCNYLNYSWVIDPEPLGFDIENHLNPDQDILTIGANVFVDKEHIQVTVSSGKSTVVLDTTYEVKIPALGIECLSNCNSDVGNTMEETKLRPVCYANCNHLDYVWAVNTYSPGKVKMWVDDKHLLIIPPGNLISGDNTFTISSGKGTATLTRPYEKPIPELIITCEANCIDPNPAKETVLKVDCLSPPNICNLEYKWFITPLEESFSWTERTSFNDHRSVLTIKPNTFKDTDVIEIKVTDGDTAEKTLTLTYTEPVPVMSVVCDKNCDASQPMYVTELRVVCESNCDADFEWEFEPKPANPVKGIITGGQVVTIAADTYSDGTSVTATVKNGKATATYTISYKTLPPVLQVQCVPPCDGPHDPKDVITINVTCAMYCPKALHYTWKIEPAEHDAKKVIHQKNLDSVVLLPDTFADGKTATVTVSSQTENETPITLIFSENPPEIILQCVSNCWEANPLQDTVLSATCTDFCKNIDSYEWELEPKPKDWGSIIFSPKNLTMTIKPELYKDLENVTVTLIARNAKKTNTVTFIELAPVLTASCIQNCNPSNPFEDVVLEVNCTKYCHRLQYEWDKVEPVPEGWDIKTKGHLARKNATLVLLKNLFEHGDAHRFFVKSRKGSAYCDVRFAVPPAELKLVCVSKCQPSANPFMELTIQAMCLKFCYSDYLWSLSPAAEKLEVPEAKGPNNTLVIPAESYPDQGSVRVKIVMNQSETFMDIYFVEPTPVLNVTCVTCDNGIQIPVSDAIFTVSCLQNCDHLTYTWDFSPTAEKTTYGPENTTATIPKLTFEDKQQLLVTARARKGKAEIPILYRMPPGYIIIGCIQNCPYANPLHQVVYNITCVYDCNTQEWIWDIEPHDPNFIWTTYIKTDSGNTTLTILPQAFADGQVVQLNAWADGSDYLKNKTVIKFEEPTPNVTIACWKNCNPLNPLRDVEIAATCLANCEVPTYEWKLEPKSHHVMLAKNNENIFTIKAGSYFFNETITILLKFRKAHVNLTVTFGPAGWDGQCFIEPEAGISGVTLFAIGCDYFQDGVTYRAYQDNSGNALGVLLTYGQSKFFDYVYLSAGKSSLTVAVGNGFETKKKIRLKVGTVQPIPQAKSRELFKKIIGEDRGDFFAMVKRKTKLHRTVQFASLLWTALEGMKTVDVSHYSKHIIAGINTLWDKIEPTQLLSLYTKFIKPLPADMFTIRLLTEGIEKTVQHLISMKNTTLYQNDETLPGFCNDTLSLLSTLFTQALSLAKKQPSFDYTSKKDFEPTGADFRRHLRKFTHDLVATTEALPKLLTTAEIRSKQINLKIGKLSGSDVKTPVSLSITGSKSYVQTSPKFGHTLQETGEEFKYAVGFFDTNPFGWQDLGINTDVVQLTADSLPEPIYIHLSFKKSVTSGEFTGKVVDKIIYEFSVKRKAVFTVTFSLKDNPYKVHTYPNILKTTVNRTETLDYTVEEEKFIYIEISTITGKETEYTATYQLLECFSWPTGNLAPTKDGCMVFNKFPKFVSCECSHLSHFAGKQSIPEISIPTTKTFESAPMTPNFFIPIIAAVSFIIFLLLVAFAFYKDNTEKSQVGILPDNQPGDNELYLINIATGITAETTSSIAIELTGTESKSRIHLIQDEINKPLKRNDEHFFAIYTEKNLGDLISIRMWTNSKGDKPDWYCERVMIEHVMSGKKYLFITEKWFSLLDGDCSGTFTITTPKLKFGQRLREAIRDNHHLLTLFTQRPRGVNKETVVIGYATCSFAMFVALVLTIYAPEIAVLPAAAISAAVTIPITFLLNHLFRNSP